MYQTTITHISEDQLCKNYNNWFNSRSTEEFQLHTSIQEYEEVYFEDMLCKEGSLCWDIGSFAINEIDFLYLELDANYYQINIVDDNPKYHGRCNGMEHLIEITQSHIKDKGIILHEMIHAYEYILQYKTPVLCELLLLRLYEKLKTLIPDLNERIASHSELYGQSKVTYYGGYHGILFFLKSLDLDIRCGYNLGTVCGYGRDSGEMFY